jgi:hypothetical protein
MAVELNDTTIPATYQHCCCEDGPAARVATAV